MGRLRDRVSRFFGRKPAKTGKVTTEGSLRQIAYHISGDVMINRGGRWEKKHGLDQIKLRAKFMELRKTMGLNDARQMIEEQVFEHLMKKAKR